MSKKLAADVEVITTTMTEEEQIRITDKVRELAQPGAQNKVEEREVANALKKFLDDEFQRMWHVVLLTGSYWMNYSHEPDHSFQFRLGRYVYLVWRTPAS